MEASQVSIQQQSLVNTERMDQDFPDQSNILGKQHSSTTKIVTNNLSPSVTQKMADNSLFATIPQQNNKQSPNKSKDLSSPIVIHFSDTENHTFEDQIDMSMDDEEQSSNDTSDSRTKTYSTQQSKHSSPKSSTEASVSVDDRKIRRQIANSNERRRMETINQGFAALRQFLPQRCGEKLSKASILKQASELIQSLQSEKCRHSSGERGAKSDEEATMDNDRPQCKKRRTVIKNEPKEPIELINCHEKLAEDIHRVEQIEYTKIIDELRSALGKERQLRLLYEQKFSELKTTLSASMNLDRSENTQHLNQQQRSSSADGLLAPKSVCDLSI